MKVFEHITNTIKANPEGAVLIGGLAFILGDAIPTPADSWYFRTQYSLNKKLREGTITPRQYWIRDGLAYYGYNPLWWGIVFTATAMAPGIRNKLLVGGGLISAGIVFATLNRNIKKDTAEMAEKK